MGIEIRRSSTGSPVALDAVFREQWGRVLATLVGVFGDIELAEDAAAEAFAVAACRWPVDGEPANPTGWLITTARNRALDQLRRRRVLAAKTELLARELAVRPQQGEPALVDVMPDESEVHALQALMLLNDARRSARTAGGKTVPLDEQDRSLWDARQLGEGRALLQRAMSRGNVGPYLLQAAIADLHLQQPRDWPQIAALYQTLSQLTRSPVVELNRAIAVAEVDGPAAGLALLEPLPLKHYRYYHSTRAALLRRLGNTSEAFDAYSRALKLAETEPERQFLRDQLTSLPPRR